MLLIDHARALLEFEQQAHRTALYLLRDRDAANDAVQDAYCRALAYAESYDRQYPLKPWFLQIVRNACYAELRRKARTCAEVPEIACPEAVDARVLAVECAREIAAAMKRLRPAYRTAIEMRSRGQTYEQIARSLHVPMGTARTLLHRGRRELKSMLVEPYANACISSVPPGTSITANPRS